MFLDKYKHMWSMIQKNVMLKVSCMFDFMEMVSYVCYDLKLASKMNHYKSWIWWEAESKKNTQQKW